jgi:hypothetical protein
MSKIIQVANVMIMNNEKISKVLIGDGIPGTPDEYFFLYKEKYKWSIIYDQDDDYQLFYYPTDQTIEELASRPLDQWEGVSFMKYSSKNLKTREANETFRDLYQIVKEKVFGIDAAFDDIMGDSFLS